MALGILRTPGQSGARQTDYFSNVKILLYPMISYTCINLILVKNQIMLLLLIIQNFLIFLLYLQSSVTFYKLAFLNFLSCKVEENYGHCSPSHLQLL